VIVRDAFAGGGRAVYSLDVPPDTAARIFVKQEGIDVNLPCGAERARRRPSH
jgi:hypothetical protein